MNNKIWPWVLSGFAFSVLVLLLNMEWFIQFAFLNPEIEAVRNDTFHSSQAYNEGMVRDLYELKRQYDQGNPRQREGLRAMILHQFSVYPQDRLPADLQFFYQTLKGSN